MKKILLPMLVFIVAVSMSAFTAKGITKHRSLQTFVYTGTTSADQDEASLYVLESTNPNVSCSGAQQIICHVDAEPDGSGQHPDFSNGDPVSAPENFENISKRQLP